MKTVCELNRCNGCMLCVDACNKNAVTVLDNIKNYNAIIDEGKCVDCGICHRVCPNNNFSVLKPISWQQGWASKEEVRKTGSSGGIATAILVAFVENGGVVCSCVFEEGEFLFKIVDNINDVNRFSGSKYVKSNPIGIYKKLKKEIISGKKVLFIGLPCQVTAVKNYICENERLYTIDLICHGTPSPQLLNKYFKENNCNTKTINDLKFRRKSGYELPSSYKGIKPNGLQDRYTYAFLNSLCYTENCYSCKFAQLNRAGDVSLGDSWGSQISKEEQEKGISLVLCQSEKGKELINMADLHLENVDLENAIKNNEQLNEPSKKPKEYESFFNFVISKGNFSKAVKKSYPKFCLKQDVKTILSKLKIIRNRNSNFALYLNTNKRKEK